MDELRYVIYARKFGWTPEQVDAMPASVERWFFPIDAAIEADADRRIKAEQAAAAAAKQKGGRHRR